MANPTMHARIDNDDARVSVSNDDGYDNSARNAARGQSKRWLELHASTLLVTQGLQGIAMAMMMVSSDDACHA